VKKRYEIANGIINKEKVKIFQVEHMLPWH